MAPPKLQPRRLEWSLPQPPGPLQIPPPPPLEYPSRPGRSLGRPVHTARTTPSSAEPLPTGTPLSELAVLMLFAIASPSARWRAGCEDITHALGGSGVYMNEPNSNRKNQWIALTGFFLI